MSFAGCANCGLNIAASQVRIPHPLVTSAGQESALRHRLLDGTENTVVILIQHLDPDTVAKTHEGCHGLSVLDRFEHALFGKTTRPLGSVVVGYCAGANDGARAQAPRLGHVFDELMKIECHVDIAIGLAEQLSV